MAENATSGDVLCPCRSGREFKQCHGRPARPNTVKPLILVALLLVSVVVLIVALKYGNADRAEKKSVPSQPQRVTNYGAIPGLGLQILPAEEQTQLVNHLNHSPCTCDCNMTVAECRNLDPSCRHSKEIAEASLSQLIAVGSPVSGIAPRSAH